MITRLIDGAKRRRAEVMLVASMSVLYAFSYFQRVAVPGTIFDEVQRDMALSSSAVALLGGIYLYIYGGIQIPAGLLVDRFGSVRMILLGGAILAVGSILFPLSQGLVMLYGTRALVGLGGSLMYLCLLKETDSRVRDTDFSAVIGILAFVGYVGGMTGTFPFERVVRAFGWRHSLLAAGIASAVAVALVGLLARSVSRPPSARRRTSPIPAVLGVLRDRHSYPMLYAGSMLFSPYFVVQAIIGKKLVEDCCGVSSAVASMYTFAMMVTIMICVTIGGFLPSLIENRRRPIQIAGLCVTTLASIIMVATLSTETDARWVLASYILFAFAAGNNAVFICSMKESSPPEIAATAVGVMNMTCYLVNAALTTFAGAAMDAFRSQAVVTASAVRYPPEAYRAVFAALLVLSVLGIGAAAMIRETRGKNVWEGNAE